MIADERSDLDTKLHDLATAKSVDSRGRSLGARAQVWADLPDIKDAMLSSGGRPTRQHPAVAEKHYIARRIVNDHAAEALNRISTDPIT